MAEIIVVINGNAFLGIEKGNDRGLRESSIFVTAQAKRLAPVDNGQLRNSIMYKTGEREKGGFNDSGGKTAEIELQSVPKKGQAFVGSNLDYSVYQEFGTRKMPPQPFLRPAGALLNIDIVKEASIKEMREALSGRKKVLRFRGVR